MPHSFTFGIPNYFSFTFRAGPRSPSLDDETVHVELDSKDKTDPSTSSNFKALTTSPSKNAYPSDSNEIKVLVSSPSSGTTSSPCGSLSKIPLEIRIMIYKRVLCSERYIKQAHIFLERYPPIMANQGTHVEAIDPALLRTCRAMYQEAIHILYGVNHFYFKTPKDIEVFAHLGLGNTPFGFYRTANEPAPYGRFTMIRLMTLRIGTKSDSNDRKEIWSLWRDFFYPPEDQDQLIRFPALECLALDFIEWELNAGNASKIRVRPFLNKLRPTGGLKHLTLIGVKHEQNLLDFKHGFVRQGGTFRPDSISVKKIPTTTVTHEDLPEVSMYVRAIVEKDRAS